ncbi:hypothetical protein QBC34DRAFT_165614 [Podospora aff. communis PSN243]|uniref:Extracellular membrane protein CFEM domain-containing protein n=1 Tax=Podospora aff. communis PSN243 TaxID=3040156 RepID=A0AAV9GA10_9PEZI|nr:hypothetical protein QBC34DRAFT_165614 [Podospora aff. communis PSN243]
MSPLFRVLVTALAAATLSVAQSKTCEDKCASKQLAAIKCETMECFCFAYDDPDYVSCMQSECGKGYASVRELQVMTCQAMGTTLSPDPPGTSDAGTQTTTGASNPQATGTGTTSTTSGGNSGGSSGSGSGSASNTSSNSQSSGGKEKLSTAELIGIIIGSVSAVATIIGVWVTIRRRKGRGNDAPTRPPIAYQPVAPQAPVYPPVHPPVHVAPIYHGPPPGYQPPPAYHTVHVTQGWRK